MHSAGTRDNWCRSKGRRQTADGSLIVDRGSLIDDRRPSATKRGRPSGTSATNVWHGRAEKSKTDQEAQGGPTDPQGGRTHRRGTRRVPGLQWNTRGLTLPISIASPNPRRRLIGSPAGAVADWWSVQPRRLVASGSLPRQTTPHRQLCFKHITPPARPP